MFESSMVTSSFSKCCDGVLNGRLGPKGPNAAEEPLVKSAHQSALFSTILGFLICHELQLRNPYCEKGGTWNIWAHYVVTKAQEIHEFA